MALACLAYGQASFATQEKTPAWSINGFAQLRADWTDDNKRPDFGADRIRVGARYVAARYSGKLLRDFNANNGGQRVGNTLPKIVQDVFIDVRLSQGSNLRIGQFKTPLGMDFNTPGTQLDIAKRGMEKPLVLERDTGLMLSMTNQGAFSADLGLFNPADRSGAVNAKPVQGTQGKANAFAARLRFDHARWHVQGAIARSEQAGGLGSDDYEVFDIGFRWQSSAATLKAEYIRGSGILGEKERQESVWFAHLGLRPKPQHELVIRHYAGRSEEAAGATSRLSNTYFGWTYWPRSEQYADLRLQLNYQLAGGDTRSYSGLGGLRSDAVFLQIQIKGRSP